MSFSSAPGSIHQGIAACREKTGELGTGVQGNAYPRPEILSTLAPSKQMAGGWGFSFSVSPESTLKGVGYNRKGNLGNGTISRREIPNVLAPVAVANDLTNFPLTDIVGIAGGYDHAVALSGSGKIWTWGAKDFFQVSSESAVVQPIPVPVILGNPSVPETAVATGSNQTLAISSDGRVWQWGRYATSTANVTKSSPENLTNFPVLGLSDEDGDGLAGWEEAQYGLSPHNADTDGDGFDDGFEIDHFLDSTTQMAPNFVVDQNAPTETSLVKRTVRAAIQAAPSNLTLPVTTYILVKSFRSHPDSPCQLFLAF